MQQLLVRDAVGLAHRIKLSLTFAGAVSGAVFNNASDQPSAAPAAGRAKRMRQSLTAAAASPPAGAGVVMTPEIVWWEADFVRDVVVRNNLVRSMAPGVWLGACVAANDGGDQTPAAQRLNRRISVVGNTIEGSLKTPMMITSAADVLIEGNAFRGCLPGPGSSKDHSWEVEGKQLLVAHCDGVRLAGNSFLAGGRAAKGDAADTAAFVALVDVGGAESTAALLASEA